MPDLVGHSLGHYQILEQLGEGGMAVVYKARDTRLEREVAIKVILPGFAQSEKFLKRFEREAHALAKLNHPHIVRILDHGEQEGLPYLVMEYQPGGMLKKLLDRPFPWRQAAALLAPVALALEYAHQQQVIHRDVKPANILMTETGQPMLSDFGIAKILESEVTVDLTSTGVGIGTPEYMSPEQALGQEVDARTDIYSLGVVFYEMVTGRKPYRADTPMAILHKQLSEPLPRPSLLVAGLPESVERVLLKALTKKAEDRYQSMGDFAAALESLSEGHQVTVLMPGEESGTPPTVARKRRSSWPVWALAAGGLGLLCLLAASAALVIYFLTRSQEAVASPAPGGSGSSQPTSTPRPAAHATTGAVAAATQDSAVYFPLAGCGPARLYVGDSAYVAPGGTHNDIRTSPDTHPSDNTFREAEPGEVLEIVGGPECDQSGSGWVMWQVRTVTGELGWTPESDGNNFWLLPLETYTACPGTLPSRLHSGDLAMVSLNGVANRLRDRAGTSGERIGTLQPGETVQILNGPSCSDGLVWFEVQSLQNGETGWTAEGASDGYWLIPLVSP